MTEPVADPSRIHSCRSCGAGLEHVFVDLGQSPLANSFLSEADLQQPEAEYPLRVLVCDACLLVQLPEFESPDKIFTDYAYFSSYSQSWLDHARRYADEMTTRFGLGRTSKVVEVASNDGYLLRFFKDQSVPVLGIEPAANVAEAALAAGIDTRVEFFGEQTATRLLETEGAADLLLGNNVLAHVPDLNDFVRGLRVLLAPDGVITMEFPHVMRLIERNQFDTIYHEHFSYFSLGTVQRVFARHGLEVFDVDELPTHGGSLRVYAAHADSKAHSESAAVARILATESGRSLDTLEGYSHFEPRVRSTRDKLLEFINSLKAEGSSVAGYGAPAKGNTLLNYCGIGPDTLDYTVDKNPHKQGKFLPGSRIPVFAPERLRQTKPEYVFVLPWNLRDEISAEWAEIKDWGARFFVAIPEIEVL